MRERGEKTDRRDRAVEKRGGRARVGSVYELRPAWRQHFELLAPFAAWVPRDVGYGRLQDLVRDFKRKGAR